MEKTLTIIKPDATERDLLGHILNRFEKAGFKIVEMKMMNLSKDEAGRFYEVHKERPFYGELTDYMSSGPIVPIVLEKDNAIADLRLLIGATDPAEAASGTLRDEVGMDKGRNSVHASDSLESAAIEIPFFFG